MVKQVHVHLSSLLRKEDWETLRLFCDKARRLAATKLASAQTQEIRGRIGYGRENGLSFESELPAEEVISEFLMAFRFFYLQNEPTHFPKILGLISKHTQKEDVRKALKSFGKNWRDSLFGRTLNIRYNDSEVTSALLLDLWFNAYYFHQNQTKREELDQIIEIFSERFAKYMLLDSAITAAHEVFKIFEGVHEIVDKHFHP